jgi:MtrB/PioB family decaheme-associated outer membrane protein
MSTFSPLFLLATLGVLSTAAGDAVAAPDTSQWKCETCPFEKTGVTGAVDAGLTLVSDKSAKFGDFTGLDRKGGYLSLGGELRYRADGGSFGNFSGSTGLGLIDGDVGTEGIYRLSLRYAEIPHHLSDDGATPFLGVGGARLTLPGGFPAATTTAMPLASTLQPVEIGTTRKRLDLGVAIGAHGDWTHRLSVRHEVKDGLQRTAGSFFSTASQLAAPVDQVTDQFEVSTTYTGPDLHGTLAYQVSLFRNALDAVTWANPFTPVVAGATKAQLALAPDNQFHQVAGSAGAMVTPMIRASADFAVGRLTQDQAYLATTTNATLTPAAAPQASLAGKVDTFSGNVNLTASPLDHVRVNASYSRDVRDNRTSVATYALVATDMFLGGTLRNTPFTFKQDRYKLSVDYRGPGTLKASAGFDENDIERSYQEAQMTRESSYWGKFNVRPMKDTWLAVKLSHAERRNNGYGVAPWLAAPENPLLRKFNMADRMRDAVRVRADVALGEKISLGLNVDHTNDNYTRSAIGLTEARSASFGADLSAALTDEIQLTAFAQGDRIRSLQKGSQAFTVADWSGFTQDIANVVGIGAKYVKDKLELGADLTVSRSRSNTEVAVGFTGPAFPTATTAMDSLKLSASYRLKDNLTLIGNFWVERVDSQDWRVDGVMPNTVPNLLALGEQAPKYHVNVLRVAVRYRF